jgi:hypothetical protein
MSNKSFYIRFAESYNPMLSTTTVKYSSANGTEPNFQIRYQNEHPYVTVQEYMRMLTFALLL